MAAFREILGHSRETGVLKNSIKRGKVAHSLLLSGPDGVGKRLVALALARALNCAEPVDGDSCGRCADCALMEAGNHPHLIQVSPINKKGEAADDGVIKIDQVRDVQAALRYRVERGKKAVIIDGAERLMPAAANAFLKTLEEPPPDSVIMLVTSRPSELLATILSRCHRINFRPIPVPELGGSLEQECGLPKDEALSLARLCGGSMGAALRYVNDGAYEKRREVLGQLGSLLPGDTEGALRLAEDLAKRDDLDEILEFMKSWYRDRAVVAGGAPFLAVNSDFKDLMESPGGGVSAPPFRRLIESFSMIENAKRSIAPPRYGNRQLTMEVLMLFLVGGVRAREARLKL